MSTQVNLGNILGEWLSKNHPHYYVVEVSANNCEYDITCGCNGGFSLYGMVYRDRVYGWPGEKFADKNGKWLLAANPEFFSLIPQLLNCQNELVTQNSAKVVEGS